MAKPQNGPNDRRNPSDRKNARRAEAERHTFEMDERLGSEIDRAVRGTLFFDAAPKPAAGQTGVVPEVEVVDEDSVAAVLARGRGRADMCDLAVLDFASFTHPGGGYDRGTMAQDGWYSENRRTNLNCELYRDRAMVVPKVRFEREKYHSYADVIVAAAPNARRARADYHLGDDVLERAMRSRVRLVLAIADSLGHDKLVLGAFGCGVFGWDAATVARILLEELAGGTHRASKVTLAIPRRRHDENLDVFSHVFAKFPQANEEPYTAPLVAEPVEPKHPEKDDEDEGEPDWKKYL